MKSTIFMFHCLYIVSFRLHAWPVSCIDLYFIGEKPNFQTGQTGHICNKPECRCCEENNCSILFTTPSLNTEESLEQWIYLSFFLSEYMLSGNCKSFVLFPVLSILILPFKYLIFGILMFCYCGYVYFRIFSTIPEIHEMSITIIPLIVTNPQTQIKVRHW